MQFPAFALARTDRPAHTHVCTYTYGIEKCGYAYIKVDAVADILLSYEYALLFLLSFWPFYLFPSIFYCWCCCTPLKIDIKVSEWDVVNSCFIVFAVILCLVRSFYPFLWLFAHLSVSIHLFLCHCLLHLYGNLIWVHLSFVCACLFPPLSFSFSHCSTVRVDALVYPLQYTLTQYVRKLFSHNEFMIDIIGFLAMNIPSVN